MAAKKLSTQDIFLVHLSSRLGVLVSAVAFFIALGEALAGNYWVHVSIISGSVMAGFVVAIAASYMVSGLRGKQVAAAGLVKALLVSLPIAAPLSPLLALYSLEALNYYVALVLAGTIVPAIVAAKTAKHTVRTSMAGIAFSGALGAAYMLWGAATSSAYDYIWFYTGFLYAYPIPMIYSVSVHSFPSTYREKPIPSLYWAAMLLDAIGLALYTQPSYTAQALLVLAASLALYFPSIGFHRAGKILERIKTGKTSPIVRKTHTYFLAGHFYAAASAAITIAYAALYAYNGALQLECVTHATAIGFIGAHIFIHAPLMLPVILGIPTARRYSQAPYATLILAPLAFCYNQLLALALALLAVLLMTYIVWPPPRKKK